MYKTLCVYVTAFLLFVCSGFSFAQDMQQPRMRALSSKRNEKIFNRIAIDLLNGKSRFIPLDHMVKILDDYNVVEFHFKEMAHAKEIILKELAYRMIKSHYLPRVGDKIRIYKQQAEIEKSNGFGGMEDERLGIAINLPVEVAVIRDKNTMNAIHWKEMVDRISAVVEELWLNRMRYAASGLTEASEGDRTLLMAAALFRKSASLREDINIVPGSINAQALSIAQNAHQKFKFWLDSGHITEQDAPVLAELIIQFIILSDPARASEIVNDFQRLASIADLHSAIIKRVSSASEIIKANNPSDYGAFAMLQSVICMTDNAMLLLSDATLDYPRGLAMETQKSRHSA